MSVVFILCIGPVPRIVCFEKAMTQAPRLSKSHKNAAPDTMHVCVWSLHAFGRSLNDKNKILLTSFFQNDIPKLIKNVHAKDNSHKTARMYADISSFLEGVCRDIKIMYPSTSGDYQYVQRLFTRLMDTPRVSSESA